MQATLQQHGVGGPDCLQTGENELFSASSAAQVVPGRHLDLACELPVESLHDLGPSYKSSPRIQVSTSMFHFCYIL